MLSCRGLKRQHSDASQEASTADASVYTVHMAVLFPYSVCSSSYLVQHSWDSSVQPVPAFVCCSQMLSFLNYPHAVYPTVWDCIAVHGYDNHHS